MQSFLPLLGVLQIPEGSPDAVRRVRLVENYCILGEVFEKFGELPNSPSKLCQGFMGRHGPVVHLTVKQQGHSSCLGN